MSRKIKIGLLAKIVIAIVLGIVCGLFFPEWLQRIFATFNGLFSNFLGFFVPLLILGLIVPGIANVGKSAGKLLGITLALAYTFTLFSGFFTWGVCETFYPEILKNATLSTVENSGGNFEPYFTVEMPPIMGVMSALIAAFVIGIGLTAVGGDSLKKVFNDFYEIIIMTITRVVIPLLPLYIFGIFMSMSASDQITCVLEVFLKLIVVIFAMTAVLLLVQFGIAGIVARKNPLKMLKNMLTAYFTALGTQSSAATIPVTLKQTIKNGVDESIAGFVIPLCATIHLSGSAMKITACALAISMITGLEIPMETMVGFIFMLGITMVAAPGVPGGAIMAAIGVLQSILGFDDTAVALMIALYIAMDSFGTATNVTGDGAIAVIIDKIKHKFVSK
ncbi:MAG: dicarboxylate/amino acid:cation symporter [Bacteroidales bacterium]|nr:dicarboxylate/amino acid:cation symporter [Bacteroidales bacterium]